MPADTSATVWKKSYASCTNQEICQFKKKCHFEGEKYQITREYSKNVNKKVNEEILRAVLGFAAFVYARYFCEHLNELEKRFRAKVRN